LDNPLDLVALQNAQAAEHAKKARYIALRVAAEQTQRREKIAQEQTRRLQEQLSQLYPNANAVSDASTSAEQNQQPNGAASEISETADLTNRVGELQGPSGETEGYSTPSNGSNRREGDETDVAAHNRAQEVKTPEGSQVSEILRVSNEERDKFGSEDK
jgi:hypothetical protein